MEATRNVTYRSTQYRVTGRIIGRKVSITAERLESTWNNREEWRGVYGKMPKCLDAAVAEIRAEMEPHVPPPSSTDHLPKNAGTCQVCGGAIFKLDRDGMLVLHGYKRPGCGWVIGQCPATGMEPWEKSPAHLEAYRPGVVAYLARARKGLENLKEGRVSSFTRMVADYSKPRNKDWSQPKMEVTVQRGDAEKYRYRDGYECPSFDQIHAWATMEAEREVSATEDELKRVDHLLANWKPEELKHKP